jgi:Domain of unknown function (DUF5597)/Beta-galactosidase
MKMIILCFIIELSAIGTTFSQDKIEMPQVFERDGHSTLLVDGKAFFILGGQVHNSSAWPATMSHVWFAIEKLHANTLEIPIYWEQIEPQEGIFDFSMIDTILSQARAHNVHIVLLWFATWKNGSNHYLPEWMKSDPAKYPNIKGLNGQFVDSPTPNANATLEQDSKAFTAVMKYLRGRDTFHTVIMVQVENEPGSWYSVRDYSPAAQKLFEAQVPNELLKPEVLKSLNVPVNSRGNWQEVFGPRADEYFHAWSTAKFIGHVAAAGAAEYPIPMYVNAALRDPLTNPMATSYESGGPTDNVIPIWQATAPAIKILAPDIYLSGSEKILKVLELYAQNKNPLFVPEAGLVPENVKYLYEVIARGGIGFSPFGIDDNGSLKTESQTLDNLLQFTQEYETLAPMMKDLQQWSSEGKIKSCIEREDHADQIINFGEWQATVSFGRAKRNIIIPDTPSIGRMMIVQLNPNRFLVVGALCHITFCPTGRNLGRSWQYLKVEEGYYENGSFIPIRILNGDETDWGGPRIGAISSILRISVINR